MVQSILYTLLQKQYRCICVCPCHLSVQKYVSANRLLIFVFTFHFIKSDIISHMNTFLCKENGRDFRSLYHLLTRSF